MYFSLQRFLSWRTLVIFILVLFCIRYIPLETRSSASIIKLGVSFLCLFLLLIRPPYVSKGLITVLLYYIVVFFCVIFHPDTFRWSTMLYLLSFLIVYITVYDAVVCRGTISYDDFVRLIKGLIYAYTIVLLLQQVLLIVGIQAFPILNLTQFIDRGIGANSLSGEPSTAARIMAVSYLALIRMSEIKYGRRVQIKDLWRDYKWITIGFLWTMITMISGTAVIALLLLSLYFINIKQSVVAMLICTTVIIMIPHIDYKPIQRVTETIEAMVTGDKDAVFDTDASAAHRVIPIMNLFNLDLTHKDTWFGKGIDYSISFKEGDKQEAFIKTNVIGNINEYGMISYVFLLIFVYTCIIRRFFSMETLFFFILFTGTLANVAYAWGAMMIFTVVRYFQERRHLVMVDS